MCMMSPQSHSLNFARLFVSNRILSKSFLFSLLFCTGAAHGANIPTTTHSSAAKTSVRHFRSLNQSAVTLHTIAAPTNVTVHGVWLQGISTDILTWDAVPGAVSYNVYYTTNYDQILSGVLGTTCSVPANPWHTGRYTITAIAVNGQESIPSAPVNSLGAMNPATPPNKPVSYPNGAPKIVYSQVQWNLGLPKVQVSWQARSGADYFKIYRDSKLIATGITPLTFLDIKVNPGETHIYAVSEVSIGWPSVVQETTRTKSSPVAIPLAQLLITTSPTVQITDIVPNDDGAKIFFTAVPGAVDYRAYKVSHPGTVKYSAGGLSIEMNGLDPVAGDDILVEAVDKLGPFQTLDGMFSPGMLQLDGSLITAINGQGDPSNVPNLIAVSNVIHPVPVPFSLSGDQVFLDNFRNEQPLVDTPYAQIDPVITGGPNSTKKVTEGQNDKWIMRTYDAQPGKSHLFFMGSHFMDTLYDYAHVLRAKTAVTPKSNPVIAPGQVLHITYEVDPHLSFRRLVGVIIARADDHLVFPTFSGGPTSSGFCFDWQVHPGYHEAFVYNNFHTFDVGRDANLTNPAQPSRWVATNNTYSGGLNGNLDSLDYRHKFDLYISTTRYAAFEEGRLVRQADLTKIVNPTTLLTEDQTLSWMNQTPLTVNFYHYMYHSDADHGDLMSGVILPYPFYWLNYRPYGDERHWDNMGFEVLNSFPTTLK